MNMASRKNSRENNTIDQGPQGTPGLTDGEDRDITGGASGTQSGGGQGSTGKSDLGPGEGATNRSNPGGEVY
jgi:hypothetical protein